MSQRGRIRKLAAPALRSILSQKMITGAKALDRKMTGFVLHGIGWKRVLKKAEALEARKRYREAASLYRSFVNRNALDFDAQLKLGRCYRRYGDLNLARAHLSAASDIRPGQVEVSIQLMHLTLAERRWSAALYYADFVRPGDECYLESCYGRSEALFGLDRLDEATDWLREVVRSDPQSTAHRLRLAEELAKLGRREEALAQFQILEQLEPGKHTRALKSLETPIRPPTWEDLPMRYKGVMSRKSIPACLAAGASILRLAEPLAAALSDHFGQAVPILLPDGRLHWVRNTEGAAESTVLSMEIVFILPEFLIEAMGPSLPDSTLAISYLDYDRMRSGTPIEKMFRYAGWLQCILSSSEFNASIASRCRVFADAKEAENAKGAEFE